jgi:hypothetical protein
LSCPCSCTSQVLSEDEKDSQIFSFSACECALNNGGTLILEPSKDDEDVEFLMRRRANANDDDRDDLADLDEKDKTGAVRLSRKANGTQIYAARKAISADGILLYNEALSNLFSIITENAETGSLHSAAIVGRTGTRGGANRISRTGPRFVRVPAVRRGDSEEGRQ